MIRTLLVALTITLTLAAGATAADTPYRIVRPDGPGPFPVVLFVSHGFDAEGLPPERRYSFGVIGYHAESARAAWAEIEQFLRP